MFEKGDSLSRSHSYKYQESEDSYQEDMTQYISEDESYDNLLNPG